MLMMVMHVCRLARWLCVRLAYNAARATMVPCLRALALALSVLDELQRIQLQLAGHMATMQVALGNVRAV